MRIVENSNTSATSALGDSSSSLLSANSIVSLSNGAVGFGETFKLNSKLSRKDAIRQNVHNSEPCLQMRTGALETITRSISRTSEAGMMANHATTNQGGLERDTSKFIVLPRKIHQLLNSNCNGATLFCSGGGSKIKSSWPLNIKDDSNFMLRIDSLITSKTGNSADGLMPLYLDDFSHILKTRLPDKCFVFMAVKCTDPQKWEEVLLLQNLLVSILGDRLNKFYPPETRKYRSKIILHPKVFRPINKINAFYNKRKLKIVSLFIKLTRMCETDLIFVHSLQKFRYRMKFAIFSSKTIRRFNSLNTVFFSNHLSSCNKTRSLPKHTELFPVPVKLVSKVWKGLAKKFSKLTTSYFSISRLVLTSRWRSSEYNSTKDVRFYEWRLNLDLESTQNTFLTYPEPC